MESDCLISRPTRLEIDLNAFRHNIEEVRRIVGKDVEIMPVIKANAYGTYINKLNNVLEDFNIVAVATVDEAVEIRERGFNKEIFVLNQPYIDEIDKIQNFNITVGLSSDSFLKFVGENNKNIKVHVEIGTGMGRTGINPSRVNEFVSEIKKYNCIKIEGIYTHLSSADFDDEYTNKQLDSFDRAVNEIKKLVPDIKYIHASASNGILNYKRGYYNLVRPGLIIYGYEPYEGAKEKIDLKPVAKLKSKITFLKSAPKGMSIGYSRSFITSKDSKIATIPIGYADGLKRSLSNKGFVLINGKKAPIVGKICMDGFMADVTDILDAKVGDDVYIWDNENITIEEVSDVAGTFNYEMLSTISERVPRVFIGGNEK